VIQSRTLSPVTAVALIGLSCCTGVSTQVKSMAMNGGAGAVLSGAVLTGGRVIGHEVGKDKR